MKYILLLAVSSLLSFSTFAANTGNPGNYPAIEVDNMTPAIFEKVSQAANALLITGKVNKILILSGSVKHTLAICAEIEKEKNQRDLEKIRNAIPGATIEFPKSGGFASPSGAWGGYLSSCP